MKIKHKMTANLQSNIKVRQILKKTLKLSKWGNF